MTDEALTARVSPPIEAAVDVNGVRVCLDCRIEIARARLKANPAAVRCVDCQNDFETRQWRQA